MLSGKRTMKIQPWPARWDLIQSGSGLLLGLFLWAHMFLVSSILLGKDAMYFVARLFEGEPIFGKPYPILVSGFAVFITATIMVHALLALRKFPGNYQQYQALSKHIAGFKHSDTRLWYLQVITGFALFFLAPVHLYQLIMHPADIGPYASSDRIWSGTFWPLYLILLFVVETHSGIGMYRLAIKWGWFLGNDPIKNRQRLQTVKWCLTLFFIVLGLLTLAAYMKIGREHAADAGQHYQSQALVSYPELMKREQ